jgi:DnaK suppressor protein
MYNPAVFQNRQELHMAAKKAASKKRKKATSTRKKAVTKKASKKKVAKKKVAKKAAAKKKVSKKKPARKKVAKKKVAKKKVSKKKPTKKKAAKKKASKKKTSKKKVSTNKVTKKKASKKKAPAKKKVSKKKVPARKKTVKKKATARKKARKPAARRPARARGDMLSGPLHGIEPYKPARGEEYMSDEQLEHFHDILSSWKRELMYEVDRTVHHMQDEAANFPDPNDRATQESEFGLELRTRDRERKLLRKIDSALIRIDDGSYGFCDETGEEIGLKRLEARPVATLCLEAQERRELAERQFRDRDDRYR